MNQMNRNSPKATAFVVKLGKINATKIVLEPGWKWSEFIKPSVRQVMLGSV